MSNVPESHGGLGLGPLLRRNRSAARCRRPSATTDGGGGGQWKARLTQSTRAMSSSDDVFYRRQL
eukprot:5436380-Prymnesium_polylepis.1